MAKLQGPCMSSTAFGAVGKVLVFDRYHHVNSVRLYSTAKDKVTKPRLVIREINKLITIDWKNANETIKQFFKGQIKEIKHSTFNIFSMQFFNWIFDGRYDDGRYETTRYQ